MSMSLAYSKWIGRKMHVYWHIFDSVCKMVTEPGSCINRPPVPQPPCAILETPPVPDMDVCHPSQCNWERNQPSIPKSLGRSDITLITAYQQKILPPLTIKSFRCDHKHSFWHGYHFRRRKYVISSFVILYSFNYLFWAFQNFPYDSITTDL